MLVLFPLHKLCSYRNCTMLWRVPLQCGYAWY